MLSTIVARGGSVENHNVAHLTSYVALFVGFCLTLLGILWLLFSQNLDAHGLSRPWPFAFGTTTTYLALSQTRTAFMHEFLIGFESVIEATEPGVGASTHHALPFDALDQIPLLILLVLGGVSWALTTYVAPLLSTLKSPVPRGRRWWFAAYYFTLQVPIYWVYAHAWHLQYAPAGEPMNMPVVFALQFIQPLLWFR